MDDDEHPETDAAEQATAGALILADEQTRAHILATVADDDFTDPRARCIVTTIRAMTDTHTPIDQVTIAAYIRTHGLTDAPRLSIGVYLHDLTVTAPTPVTGPWYAAAVVETTARRRVNQAAGELARTAQTASLTELTAIVTRELVATLGALNRAAGAL